MPCNVDDISINLPSGPATPSIPGFGPPFSISLPSTNFPLPSGFPEDLISIFSRLKLIIPSGTLQPSLNPNFGKDIYDGIMKLLDQFFPFLMLYKFFLPVLNLIICIIEVICAIKNPIKLFRAIRKLFRNCIPEFLSLFPIFALIVMLISLLLLLLELIEYIIAQIQKLINTILRNINALAKAIEKSDEESIKAISRKIAAVLCIFNNLFVLLAAFAIIIQTIKDILNIKFRIPPCSTPSSGATEQEVLDSCCGPDVCPDYVLSNTSRATGSLQHLNSVVAVTNVPLPLPVSGLNYLSTELRPASFQLYDNFQNIDERFINIVDAYDVPEYIVPKPVFFPTDSIYTKDTPYNKAPYTVDLQMYYDPKSYNRFGTQYGDPRNIIFKNCIVLNAPTTNLDIFNNSTNGVANGVLDLGGGLGYEADGITPLYGFSDGYTITTNQATLENFVGMPTWYTSNPSFDVDDGYLFSNVSYTLKPNFEVLFSKDLVSSACYPPLRDDVNASNTIFGNNFNFKLDLFTNLINSDSFPDPAGTQECLQLALDVLRTNLNEQTLAEFQAQTTLCLDELKSKSISSISDLMDIGVDTSKSFFTITPSTQFTTQKIIVKVTLKDGNNQSIATNLTQSIGETIASKLTADVLFGKISKFVYDGSDSFIAEISSDEGGVGEISVSFNDQSLTVVSVPDDLDTSITSQINVQNYKFIYAPAIGAATSSENNGSNSGDEFGQSSGTDGQSRRDVSDI